MKVTKKIIKILCIMALCVLTLTGCGKNGESGKASSKFDAKKIAGKYELIEMTTENESYTEENLKLLKSYGLEITMELKEDKTGTLTIYGESQEFTFDKDNITVEDEKTPYKVEDNKITFEQDGTKMTFRKME